MTEQDRIYESYSAFWTFAREVAERANALPCWKHCRPHEGCACDWCERTRESERRNREVLG